MRRAPLEVMAEQGRAAAARSYALLTAVLEAIVVEEAVLVLSESFDCKLEGTTASVVFIPAWTSASVASVTTPSTVVDA